MEYPKYCWCDNNKVEKGMFDNFIYCLKCKDKQLEFLNNNVKKLSSIYPRDRFIRDKLNSAKYCKNIFDDYLDRQKCRCKNGCICGL